MMLINEDDIKDSNTQLNFMKIKDIRPLFKDKISEVKDKFVLRKSWSSEENIGVFDSRKEAKLVAIILSNVSWDVNFFNNKSLFEYNDEYYMFKTISGKVYSLGVFASKEDLSLKIKEGIFFSNCEDPDDVRYLKKRNSPSNVGNGRRRKMYSKYYGANRYRKDEYDDYLRGYDDYLWDHVNINDDLTDDYY